MATGDIADILQRIKAVLPGGWFPSPQTAYAPQPPPESLFGTTVPGTADGGVVSGYTLGMAFQSSSSGTVNGVRFYKASTNTGTHIGYLYTGTGGLLAQVTFSGETTSGWQQANFATPVAIAANVQYIVAYAAPNGHFPVVTHGLINPTSNGADLSTPANAGRYIAGAGAFPSVVSPDNYWVDVAFQANAPAPNSISATPVLDAVLTGCSYAWSWLYGLIWYVRQQTRMATATDVWLDAISADYFGGMLPRLVGESDSVFSARIRANLFAPRATRAAMTQILTALTGKAPIIFEPSNTGDTGAYGTGETPTWRGMAYNTAGGWGSLQLPFQAFITVHNQNPTAGIPSVAGYYYGSGIGLGGYGVGAIEYLTQPQTAGVVSNSQIYQTIANAQPVGYIMWTAIEP